MAKQSEVSIKKKAKKRFEEILSLDGTPEEAEDLLSLLDDFASDGKARVARAKALEDLRVLVRDNASEEVVHQHLVANPSLLYNRREDDSEVVSGIISKFPVSPERIPDFSILGLPIGRTQYAGHLTFLELKRPDARLFVSKGRLSQDLNDAWMEAIECLRLVGTSYREVLHRLVARVAKDRLKEFEKQYVNTDISDLSYRMPYCTVEIVIGRRKGLDDDELLRVRELTATTNRTVRILTYDGFVEHVDDGRIGASRYQW